MRTTPDEHRTETPHRHRRRWFHRLLLAASLIGAVPAVTAGPVGAIADGANAPTGYESVVQVRHGTGRCTGTLIATDLVLTAGHCVDAATPKATFPYVPFGEGWLDPEDPDRFYDIDYRAGAPVSVRVGRDATAWLHSSSVSDYSLPNSVDVIVLRLDAPVPAWAASPEPVLMDTFADDPSAFWEGKALDIAGWGVDERGATPTLLQHGRVRVAEYPCTSAAWAHGAAEMLCVREIAGIGRPGDSGGPLFWTDPNTGRRWVVGVFQGIEGADGGRFTATMYRGYERDGHLLPDLGDYFRELTGNEPRAYGMKCNLRDLTGSIEQLWDRDVVLQVPIVGTTAGYADQDPAPGRCAWSARGFRGSEWQSQQLTFDLTTERALFDAAVELVDRDQPLYVWVFRDVATSSFIVRDVRASASVPPRVGSTVIAEEQVVDDVPSEGSDEQQADAGDPADGDFDPSSTEASLYRLYRAYFLRAPDRAGFDYWLATFESGVSLSEISLLFSTSEEFRTRYGTLDDAGFVRLVYVNVLEREPEPSGYDYWVAQMGDGMSRGDVMVHFSDSPEYRATTADAAASWM